MTWNGGFCVADDSCADDPGTFPYRVAGLNAGDLVATNLTTGAAFAATGVAVVGTAATFALPADLPDGDYRFALPAGAAADTAGNPLAAATLDGPTTFVLAGDANRDRAVDFADLSVLALNYGQAGRTFAQGNFDYDAAGSVGFADLALLAARYGTALPAPRPASTTRGGEGRVARDVLA